jgi:hypothetical protein
MSPAEVKQAIARNRRAAMAMQNFAQRQATAASGEIPDWRVARSRITVLFSGISLPAAQGWVNLTADPWVTDGA